jgi:hypothetical protein
MQKLQSSYFIIIICYYILVDLSYIMNNDPWIQNKSNQIKWNNFVPANRQVINVHKRKPNMTYTYLPSYETTFP